MIEVVAFACRGTLLDWAGAVEAVLYELARRNGVSPLDRGAELRRRVEELADGQGLEHGFEQLARERAYRIEASGAELLARAVAVAAPLPGARDAVALAIEAGKRVVAVSRGVSPGALYLFGGVFEDVVTDPAEIDAAPDTILYVSTVGRRRAEARRSGMHATTPDRLAQALVAQTDPTSLAVR
jgi:beta-phosphoglucomutase-like phosphatase (HAD superfamily)